MTFIFRASSQNYSIDWFTIDGGGGTSSGGSFTLSGSIGQPDAGGAMSGGNYSLTGGFWSLFAVPEPGAPKLTIRLTSTNTAIVSWPAPSTGYVLQQKGNLAAPNWLNAPEPVFNDGTNKFIIVNPPAGTRFFRLSNP